MSIQNSKPGETFKQDVKTINILKRGFHNFILTNIDNDLEPQIEEFSYLEVNGTIYEWENTIEVEGDLSEIFAAVFIRTNVVIENGEEVLTVVYDKDLLAGEVSWISSKKGFYDNNNNRIIGSFFYNYKSNTFSNKKMLLDRG